MAWVRRAFTAYMDWTALLQSKHKNRAFIGIWMWIRQNINKINNKFPNDAFDLNEWMTGRTFWGRRFYMGQPNIHVPEESSTLFLSHRSPCWKSGIISDILWDLRHLWWFCVGVPSQRSPGKVPQCWRNSRKSGADRWNGHSYFQCLFKPRPEPTPLSRASHMRPELKSSISFLLTNLF